MVDISKKELYIFDVDGTLYCQSKMRRVMRNVLVKSVLRNPFKILDFWTVFIFRKLRERMAGKKGVGLNEFQYKHCSKYTLYSSSKVERAIKYWMYEAPLKFLPECRYDNVDVFFKKLQNDNKLIAIYSDYPAIKKVSSLGLYADIVACSTDSDINSLKPNTDAINYILDKMNIMNDRAVFIGDRDELDGECAKRSGVDYINIKSLKNKYIDLIDFYDRKNI